MDFELPVARSSELVEERLRLQTLRLLHVCSGRFRLERSPGGACTLEKRRLVTAHVDTSVQRDHLLNCSTCIIRREREVLKRLSTTDSGPRISWVLTETV